MITHEAGAAASVKPTETIRPKDAVAYCAEVPLKDPAIPIHTRRTVLTPRPQMKRVRRPR